ncbi:MAG: ribosomal RNA small subunit methyltransferase A [Candidatus Poribacteria bacterium]|nr:MAG: ribosomal RNA small subunit methyltransferase A [Candidatus Poribacteria bacterium]
MARRRRPRLSQHFLHDPGVLRRIVEVAQVATGDWVLEIGAGRGSLTRKLCEAVGAKGKVIAVELDESLLPELEAIARERSSCLPVHADILRLNLKELLERLRATDRSSAPLPLKVVGNLPYAITTPIVERLIEQRKHWRLATIMVQEEVARRFVAPPGAPECGAISAYLHYYCELEFCFTVGPGAFTPPPRVRSAVIRLKPRSVPPVAVSDERWLFRVVRAAFAQRRKTLRNALRALPADPAAVERGLRESGIAPERRGETLTLEEFARLAEAIRSASG